MYMHEVLIIRANRLIPFNKSNIRINFHYYNNTSYDMMHSSFYTLDYLRPKISIDCRRSSESGVQGELL